MMPISDPLNSHQQTRSQTLASSHGPLCYHPILRGYMRLKEVELLEVTYG